MGMATAVIALGGNALMKKGESQMAQFSNAKRAAKSIVKLVNKYRIVITHGNGPQVGNILLRSPMPIHLAVAETEGEIGYIIQQSLINELKGKKAVASIMTQVLVDKRDKAFKIPTKPIGPFYTKHEFDSLKTKYKIKKVIGGYRRVVASPKPKKIIESEVIEFLTKKGVIVIAAGGGGIPVILKNKHLVGADAVIDKDRASACLAKNIDADILYLLTDVPYVYLNFGTKKQKALKTLTVSQAKKLMNQFEEGSMRPKVESAIDFVSSKKGRKAIIGSIDSMNKGTIIKK
ncbi:carbamate kinase [Candidatus Aenigmatarchaeota archaeon]